MKCSLSSRRTLSAGAAVLAALLFTGCTVEGPNASSAAGGASGAAATAGGAPLPIDQLCGDKPIKIAHVAGFGANSWRKITEAELKDELSACENVTVDYSQADGDLQKYITAINS
jgi:ribose transport system substrate-binding protein